MNKSEQGRNCILYLSGFGEPRLFHCKYETDSQKTTTPPE